MIKQLRLGLSSTYYSMAHTLGLRHLQDYLQVKPVFLRAPLRTLNTGLQQCISALGCMPGRSVRLCWLALRTLGL